MVNSSKRIITEAKDFDRIYRSRLKGMNSILLSNDRVEKYFFKNPWRFGFSRIYAFKSIIDRFNEVVGRKTGQRILEVGCGNGWFSINANLDNQNEWECFDVSRMAIRVARYYAKKNKVLNIYNVFSVNDFKSKQKYEVIVCINTLHHFDNLNAFKKLVNSYLKKNGLIFLYDACPDRFNTNNAACVLIIELLLTELGLYYLKADVRGNIADMLEKILFEWKNETEDKKQSVNDHYYPTDYILNFLNKTFKKIQYSEHGGILIRLLGGLRIKHPEKIVKRLIEAEELLLKKGIISPHSYCFIGKRI